MGRAGRSVLGVGGAALIVSGLLVLQNALSVRGSINELQETFAALFSLVLIAPGLVAVRYAFKELGPTRPSAAPPPSPAAPTGEAPTIT